jgi:hypothetical protein
MKKIKVYEKEIEVKDQTGKVIKNVKLNSVDMMRSAIEGYNDGLKGIKTISNMLKIYDKLNDNTTDYIELEDEQFELLYQAVDKTQWLPLILKFREFFDELEKVRKFDIIK